MKIKPEKTSSGFTLVELVAVMAIMAITAAIATPNIIGWRLNRDFTTSLQRVISMMNSARMHAVKENTPTVIVFDLVENQFRAFVDTGKDRAWNPGEDALIGFYKIPNGVKIRKSTFKKTGKPAGRRYFSYNTHGVPTRAGSVELVSTRGRTNKVIVAVNGRIRTQ